MTKLEYNGWTNWETWLIRCHCIDEIAEHIERPDEFTEKALREAVEEYALAGDPSSIAVDLIQNALNSEVDWDELYKAVRDIIDG
jgi:hypothetical protein